jgi:hypothetical protein
MGYQPLIPQGKAGENTWNARLADKLREIGYVSADFEIHFPILKGRPRKPDVAFTNGGTNIISGKMGESKEFDAFSSAQEYQQLIGGTTNLGEVFAVVYPSSRKESFILHLLANSKHERRVWRIERFEEVVDIIHEVVEERIESLKHPIEPPDASVVRLLRQGVDILYLSAKKASKEKLKEVFGGASFFDSVLSESIPREDQKTVLSKAASFLFVNQLLFYFILRRETNNFYDEIDEADISSPSVIRNKYFAKVLQKNYKPIFEIDVASLFDPELSKDGCLRVTRLVQELILSVSTHDIIGKVFHEIIPLEFRKLVAAFYTNSAAGDLLANLSISDPNIRVIDPACGSGTLLVSAYKRKTQLLKNTGEKSQHKTFLEKQITGLDVMAFSAHLAAVQLLLQQPLKYTEHLRIATIDSTFAKVGMCIKPFGETIKEAFRQRKILDFKDGHHRIDSSEITRSGTVAMGDTATESFELEETELVIMNPPFTSSRRMSNTYKTKLKKRFRANPRYAKLITGNVGYHLYFICLADQFLVKGGRMAVVMPFTTLVGGDFSELTKFLVQKYSIEYIVCGKGRSAFSENTLFSEVLFIARKNIPSESHRPVLLLTKSSPISWSENNVNSIIETARQCSNTGKSEDTELCTAVSFDQQELLPDRKTLTRLVLDLEKDYRIAGQMLKGILQNNDAVTTLLKLKNDNFLDLTVAEVVHGRSGTGEGHSLTRFGGDALVCCRTEERALMKHDRLIYDGHTKDFLQFRDRSTGDKFSVPKSAVAPALRRFAYINKFELTGDEDYVISKSFQGLKKMLGSILGEEKATQSLESIKEEWASVVESGSAKICLPGRIDLAAPGSKLLAIRDKEPIFMCSFMWGISGLNKQDEKIMVLWFNSAVFFYLALARQTVTRGSWVKLHGKQLLKMQSLNLKGLSEPTKSDLVRLYDELSAFEWTSILEQYSNPPKERRKLDLGILNALGVKDNKKANDIINHLYDAIILTLRTMQATMEAD